jgi:glucose/arabinose dehydrogenase
MLVVAQDGAVYITRPSPGDVLMLRDTDGDGKADERKLVAKKSQAHGSAIHDGMMYLATVKAVYAANISEAGTLGNLRTIVDNLPNGDEHANRRLGFGPDGMLYITVSSTGEASLEMNPKKCRDSSRRC